MDVTVKGKAKIFRNERQGRNGTYVNYATSLSRKNKDGAWENASIEVRFRRGDEPVFRDTNVDIEIVDGFLTFRKYKSQDDKEHALFYIMVLEYTQGEPSIDDFYAANGIDGIPW